MRLTLMSGSGFAVTVSRYAPRARQAPHRDQRSRLSLVLGGGYREEGPAEPLEMGPGGVLLKSHTVRHEDVFGEDGAVLLAIEFDENDHLLTRLDANCWRRRDGATAMRLGASLLEAALARDAPAVDAACADLAAANPEDNARSMRQPAWLKRLKQEVEASSLAHVDVAARAREAGVHPAHVSRIFRRCFGVSITEHAQAHGVRRALALMSRPGAALSDVALAAGFYDQSHMNRAFRRISGRAPGAHRRLIERVIAATG